MFVGGRRRSSNNVRAMQLFHELKQQFPTIPDHVVSACISNNTIGEPNEERRLSSDRVLREMLEAAAATLQQELMGQNVKMENNFDEEQQPNNKNERLNVNKKINLKILRNLSNNSTVVHNEHNEHNEPKMNASSDLNRNKVKRPDSLELPKPEVRESPCRLKPSDKCKDVHKLLNAEKPPKSPQTPKRPNRKEPPSSDKTEKPQTVETPTQTTNTLQEQSNHPQPNLNVQLSVNCSITPPNKHSTSLNLVPQLPWCQDINPRSYTSVNLTLRPPSSEPQAPIDITSKNSSLTYSTSSFDSQKGLQSTLQITVSPTGGSVSSVRTRPRSYHPEDDVESVPPSRPTGSLQDLTECKLTQTLKKQQSALERMQKALNSEKKKLQEIQAEVQRLESKQNDTTSFRTEAEYEKQLQKEIRHLQGQCERLTYEIDKQTETKAPLGETREEFYERIYVGQRGPLFLPRPDHLPNADSGPSTSNLNETDGPKWSCNMCTFQNHPLLLKCEQCDCSRILHGNKTNGPRLNQSDDFKRIQKLLGPILKSTSQPIVNNVEGGNFVRSFSTPNRNREVDPDSATSTT